MALGLQAVSVGFVFLFGEISRTENRFCSLRCFNLSSTLYIL